MYCAAIAHICFVVLLDTENRKVSSVCGLPSHGWPIVSLKTGCQPLVSLSSLFIVLNEYIRRPTCPSYSQVRVHHRANCEHLASLPSSFRVLPSHGVGKCFPFVFSFGACSLVFIRGRSFRNLYNRFALFFTFSRCSIPQFTPVVFP